MSIVAKGLDRSRCHLVVGTVVNLSPGDVLDGVAAPPEGGAAPSFRFTSIVAERLDV